MFHPRCLIQKPRDFIYHFIISLFDIESLNTSHMLSVFMSFFYPVILEYSDIKVAIYHQVHNG